MAAGEVISGVLELILEVLIPSLDHTGAAIRWLFLRKKMSYKDVFRLRYNGLIGFAVLTGIITYIFKYLITSILC